MTPINLIKGFINKSFSGFTLIELLVGVIVASIGSMAIIYSIMYVQTRNYELRIKDHAYEQLKGYTELFKGKIAADDIAGAANEKNICLTQDDNGDCLHSAILSSTIIPINTGLSIARRSGLKTKVTWETRAGQSQKIEFYVEQMVFK